MSELSWDEVEPVTMFFNTAAGKHFEKHGSHLVFAAMMTVVHLVEYTTKTSEIIDFLTTVGCSVQSGDFSKMDAISDEDLMLVVEAMATSTADEYGNEDPYEVWSNATATERQEALAWLSTATNMFNLLS